MAHPATYIGTASWSIPRDYAAGFPGEGTHLARYAQWLSGVEINSSFYKPHQPKTYARWAASVPAHFRFAIKAPQAITHDLRLKGAEGVLEDFLDQTSQLGEKRGPLLFQLPPRPGASSITRRWATPPATPWRSRAFSQGRGAALDRPPRAS